MFLKHTLRITVGAARTIRGTVQYSTVPTTWWTNRTLQVHTITKIEKKRVLPGEKFVIVIVDNNNNSGNDEVKIIWLLLSIKVSE